MIGFQSPIFGADAQRTDSISMTPKSSGFNPLFSGLTLKAAKKVGRAGLTVGFNPLFSGLTLKADHFHPSARSSGGFNPLFSGLTLKAQFLPDDTGGDRVSIPYFRG